MIWNDFSGRKFEIMNYNNFVEFVVEIIHTEKLYTTLLGLLIQRKICSLLSFVMKTKLKHCNLHLPLGPILRSFSSLNYLSAQTIEV